MIKTVKNPWQRFTTGVDSDISIIPADRTIIANPTATRTWQLYAADLYAGAEVEIINVSAGNYIILNASGGEAIQNKTSIVIGAGERVKLKSDGGNNWYSSTFFGGNGLSNNFNGAKANNTNWEDIVNLTLTKGEWLLSGTVQMIATAATTAGDVMGGISSTSGNSAVGLTEGVNLNRSFHSNVSGEARSVAIVGVRVTVTANTQLWYLKMKKDNGGANLNFYGSLTALKTSV